ncbi:MAG TPA: glycosyltransferase [Planctomycetota bacterium]|nr:glycosyltransferase [Planctomycetota bacterium]
MNGAVAPAMGRDDLALWVHLAQRGRPVTVVSSVEVPVWLRSLPGLAAVVSADDAGKAVEGTIVVFEVSDGRRDEVMAALRRSGALVLHRCGGFWRRLDSRPVEQQGMRWLRWLAQTLPVLAGHFGMLRLRPPFRHDGGACWWSSIASLRRPRAGQRVLLYEDGHPLSFPDAVHEDIRRSGGGRYSVWERGIFFAASDGSDPATNGRSYEVRVVRGDVGALVAPSTDEEGFAQAFLAAAGRRSVAASRVHRVLLLTSSLGPGGTERQFCNLALGLAARGFEVAIASLDGFDGPAGHYRSLVEGRGVRLLDLSRADPAFDPAGAEARAPGGLALLARMPDMFAAEAWKTATHVAAFSPDVLHCALDKPNLLGAIAGVCLGVPRIVLSLRNVNPTHMPHLLAPWFQRWYRLALQVPGLVLSANSHAGAADYAQWLGLQRTRFHVVHNGLDVAALCEPGDAEVAALRRELGIDKQVPVLLGVFRLSPEKQPFLWLDAVVLLRERFPDLIALHVGQGFMAEEVTTRVAARGLQHAVRLLGRRHDVPALIRAADLLLLTSAFEGIPNVALEAQWLGRPVVCTLAGGSAEAVQHGVTGAVVTRHDAADIAAACEPLLADAALRARMGEAARKFVAERFALDTMVERCLGLYAVSAPPP